MSKTQTFNSTLWYRNAEDFLWEGDKQIIGLLIRYSGWSLAFAPMLNDKINFFSKDSNIGWFRDGHRYQIGWTFGKVSNGEGGDLQSKYLCWSFWTLLTASLINPSEDINSVYITSAPCFLQSARNGGSLTSSIGANNNGNSVNFMSPIYTKKVLLLC